MPTFVETPFLNIHSAIIEEHDWHETTEDLVFQTNQWRFYDRCMQLFKENKKLHLLANNLENKALTGDACGEFLQITAEFYKDRLYFYKKWSYQEVFVNTDPYFSLELVPIILRYLEEHQGKIRVKFYGNALKPLEDYLLNHYFSRFEICQQEESLDLIVGYQFLEYLNDENETIEILKTRLNPDAHMIFMVPNIRYFPKFIQLLEGNWPFNYSHCESAVHPVIRHYSRESLLTLFLNKGLHIVDMHGIQHQFHENTLQVRQACQILPWEQSGLEGDSDISVFTIQVSVHRPKQENKRLSFNPEVLPLEIDDLKSHNCLILFESSNKSSWFPVIADYIRQIPLKFDLVCIVKVLNGSEEILSELYEYLENEQLDLENCPDLIFLEQDIIDSQIPALVQSVTTIILIDDNSQLQREMLQGALKLKKNVILLDSNHSETSHNSTDGVYNSFETFVQYLKNKDQ